MTDTAISFHPVAVLFVAPENARHGQTYDPAGLVVLAGSIRHFGRVLEPLKGYIADDGRIAVWDGGRRLSALNLIADDGDGVGRVITDAVPVIITTQEEARIASAATFVREDQHATEKFLMWNGLFDAGFSTHQIAAAVGASEKAVAQLLRFRMLAPEIFAAFQSGAMDFDAALAFTLTEDHDKQREVLASFGDKQPPSHHVRQRLTKGAVRADDRRARFVGRKAYAAAGGGFMVDLFSNREIDETWTDGTLLDRLFNEKIEATTADLKAEGWGDVARIDGGYGWSRGYERMTAEGEAKKGKPKPFTPAQLAAGTAFILFDHNEIKIERGWLKEKKAKTATAPKLDQSLYGYGHKGHHILTQVATDITKVAIANDPAAAADGLLITLAWSVLRKPAYSTAAYQLASNVGVDHRVTARPEHRAVPGLTELASDLKAWSEKLPKTMVAFCDAVAALSMADKLLLQAHCFASTLDAVETQVGLGSRDRRNNLGWMAKQAKAQVHGAWRADYDFLKGGSKEALLGVMEEVGNTPLPATAKKGDLIDVVEANAQTGGWVPKLLATFMDVADPEPTVIPGLEVARTEAEYLGWMIAYLVDEEGMDDEAAEQLATSILASDLATAGVEFGAEGYDWTQSDAGDSVAEWLLANSRD